jgi:pilus assembly protein FimV
MQRAVELQAILAEAQAQAGAARSGQHPRRRPPAPASTSRAPAAPAPAPPAAAGRHRDHRCRRCDRPRAEGRAARLLRRPLLVDADQAVGAAALACPAASPRSRRTATGTKFEDSIISGTDIKTNTVFGSTGGGVVNTGDNSLASDFSSEGLGNIDTDEVDPIAEAEVYLAYGRDAQAEEILKDALKKDPQRQEIYLKLLEIHSQHNKPQAFETVASELFAVSHGQGDVWHKAVTLGRQLDPANPMFQDSGAASPAPREAAAPASATMAPVARSPLHAAPAFSDGDISIAPDAAQAAKSPADILAGAEDASRSSASTPARARRGENRRCRAAVAQHSPHRHPVSRRRQAIVDASIRRPSRRDSTSIFI